MSRNDSPDRLEQLFDIAKAAQDRAWAPYSHFSVGSAVLDDAGGMHGGCNVENAAYPVGICAESAAIAAMILAGGKRIRDILVIGNGAALVTPCGGCRQRIREFADARTLVHIAGPEGIRASFRLDELLPHAFGPDNLDRPDTQEPAGP